MTNEKEEKKRRGKKEKEKRNLNLKKTFHLYINFNINFEKLVFVGVAICNLLTPQLGHFVILSTLKWSLAKSW